MPDTAFDSLDDYVALPRIEGLVLSPDGTCAVLVVATLKADRTGYDRSLWEIPADPADSRTPRRLTRSAKGEAAPAFTADGDLLFLSARPDGTADPDEPAQLWLLPAGGGEARPVTRLTGGVSSIEAVAAASDLVVIAAPILPSADTIEDDARLRAERRTAKVAAILHEGYPVRYWDHDLGPDEPHLFALSLRDLAEPVAASPEKPEGDDSAPAPYPGWLPRPRDLTPRPGRSVSAGGVAVTPDGTTVVATLSVPEGREQRMRLVSIDVATGAHSVLRDEHGVDNGQPVISRDGTTLAWGRTVKPDATAPTDQELWAADIDGAHPRRLAAGWDRWPTGVTFSADGQALVVAADQDGRGPVFRVPLDGGAPAQLTRDDHTYTDVRVDAATGAIVALRSSWAAPAHPVRLVGETVTALPGPVPPPDVPGRVVEVATAAADGARVRGWLMLPEGASTDAPAPLLLWIHGGPLHSWNAWSWRWNPQLAAARGYAVLLPDPALSTGYGLDYIARGWNDWGGAPYTDLMALTDAVCARDDIDASRTAAMGGSFGGYMANWVAGHTDRFRAIVTHASLWALDQFCPTTDFAPYWQRIFTPEGMAANSPHRFVRDIRTPMLVIHGDRDYRVPIGDGLRLWSDLNEHFAAADGSLPHKFLYFPDENHWILKPQHAVVWYETVFAFLDQHVHGKEWVRPGRIG